LPIAPNMHQIGNSIAVEIVLGATLLPGYNLDDIVSELKKVIGEFEYEVIRVESLPYKLDMGLFDTLKEILHKIGPTGVAVPILLTSPTDAGTFDKLGIQTYGFTSMILHEEMNEKVSNIIFIS